MNWYLFLAPLEEQNIIWIFSNLEVSTLQKSMMLSELLAFAQNWGILQTRMDQRGDHIKTNFNYFQIKKWMLQTVRAEKLDKKIVVIGLISMFPTWVMVCKLSKKVHSLQFCADLSKKFKSVETIYIYASESTHYTLSENAMISRSLSHLSWDISN